MIKVILVFFSTFLIIASFQNCGKFTMFNSIAVENQNKLDADAMAAKYFDTDFVPYLTNSDDLSYWSQKATVRKTTALMLGDEFTIIVAVDSDSQGVILSLNSGTGLEEARISIEGSVIRLSHITDSSNFSYLETSLPEKIGNQITIAAAFGASPGHISVQINGKRMIGKIETAGSPFSYSFLQKYWVSAFTHGNLNELMLYSYKLRHTEMNVVSRMVAASSEVYYVSFNSYLDADEVGEFASEKFKVARTIMNTQCVSCHSNYARMSERNFIQKGYLSAGNPAGSKLYYRLIGSIAESEVKDMPLNGTISEADVQAIADWIQGIK